MNFEYAAREPPLRVLIANALLPEARMAAIKIFNGLVFGLEQVVDMILLVYLNEEKEAISWKRSLESTCPPAFSSITITTDLPDVADADVFMVFTYLKNPNFMPSDFITSIEGFNLLYLLMKIATHLELPDLTEAQKKEQEILERNYFQQHHKLMRRKPLFFCDGLVAMDILHTYSRNVPSDSFFCSSPVPSIASSILGNHLKVPSTALNRVHVFGANDKVFHIEYERPLFVKDVETDPNREHNERITSYDDYRKDNVCTSALLGVQKSQMNPAYFSESWMKKEFIDKVRTVTSSNLHGPLFKSVRITKSLTAIWKSRRPAFLNQTIFRTVGLISDGSLGTIKGLPYILPLEFHADTWKVQTYFASSYIVKAEIKKLNKIVQEQHNTLVSLCNNFLETNMMEQLSVTDVESLISLFHTEDADGSRRNIGSISGSSHHSVNFGNSSVLLGFNH